MLHLVARAVGVGQPKRGRPDSVDVVVQQVVRLAGVVVDAVHVGGGEGMLLVDRLVLRATVLPAGAGKHDLDLGVVMPAGLQDGKLTLAVDLEVREGVLHRIDVAQRSCEVEHQVAVLHEIVHRELVADIRDVHRDAVFKACDVVEVAAVLGNQRIDQEHVRTEVDQPPGNVASDEPESTGDEDAFARVGGRHA